MRRTDRHDAECDRFACSTTPPVPQAQPKASGAVIFDYVPMPHENGMRAEEKVGPGVKVIDPSGKVLVGGTQTDWVEVPRQ